MAMVLLPGIIGGGLRAKAIAELAPQWRETISRYLWAYVLFVPIAGMLTLLGVLRALWSRRIEWRGRVYEMRSPTETMILGSDPRVALFPIPPDRSSPNQENSLRVP